MAVDDFQRQMEWVEELSGDQQMKAGSVVAWQCISTTLSELISRFNEINLAPVKDNASRNREVHLKKIIVGMLYEIGGCLDYWARILREDKLLTEEIEEKKKTFKTECKKVGIDTLKAIRNGVAFHCTDYLTDPVALVDTYRKVDGMNLASLNRVYTAAIECGYAMRSVVMNSLQQ